MTRYFMRDTRSIHRLVPVNTVSRTKRKNGREMYPGHSSFSLLPLIYPREHAKPIWRHLAISCDKEYDVVSNR